MKVIMHPGTLSGEINAVSSKSVAHRLFLCAALADVPTVINLTNVNKDITATMDCIKALGGEIVKKRKTYTVTPISANVKKSRIYNCGESGSTLRFLFPIVCALGAGGTFIGEGRLPERPMKDLTEIITGCQISGDSLPITVNGKMLSGEYKIKGNVSSQYITGLLFALPLLDGDSKIILTSNLESASYVDMTIDALNQFGIKVEKTDYGFFVKGNQQYVSPGELTVEGDWSNAAFFITAQAIGNDVKVENLNYKSVQGDRKITQILLAMRDDVTEIDVSDIPDLVPILSVAAAYTKGKTFIKNAARLRLKESDRLTAVAVNLSKMGAEIEEMPDGLIIHGKGYLKGAEVDSFNDHRIVMSMAIAATKADGDVIINGAQAAEKSYPTFFEDLKKLGGKFDVI